MVAEFSAHRGDGQLGLILHETANWTVTGAQGVALYEAASLRIAIDRAVAFAATGREVVALVRRHPEEIAVFSAQIRALAADWREEDIALMVAGAMRP